MANETPITIVGNAVADPDLRFTPNGAAVANVRIASTPRTFNKNTNEWEDGEALFLTCNVWRQAAENVAQSIQKGMRVIVQGNLKQRTYQTKEGEDRTVFEVDVIEIGPSLTFASAQVNRNPREGGGNQQQGGGNWGNQQQGGNWGNQQQGGNWNSQQQNGNFNGQQQGNGGNFNAPQGGGNAPQGDGSAWGAPQPQGGFSQATGGNGGFGN